MNGYRTIVWALVLTTIGVMETFDGLTLIPERYAGLALLIVALVTAWLRVITTTPVFSAPPVSKVSENADEETPSGEKTGAVAK